MLKIKMRRPGKPIKGRCHYKIVVAEAKSPRESSFIAQVGFCDPTKKLLEFDIPNYEKWVEKGARPTESVATLFRKYKRQESKK
jgi:small subunit ribosomal protein S16